MNEQRLKEIEERAAMEIKPLPPEERDCRNCVHEHDSGTEFCGACSGDDPTAWTESPYNLEDRVQGLLAHSREDIPELIAEVRRLRAIVDGMANPNAGGPIHVSV